MGDFDWLRTERMSQRDQSWWKLPACPRCSGEMEWRAGSNKEFIGYCDTCGVVADAIQTYPALTWMPARKYDPSQQTLDGALATAREKPCALCGGEGEVWVGVGDEKDTCQWCRGSGLMG